MRNRAEEIKVKRDLNLLSGLDSDYIGPHASMDFSKINVGSKSLDDAILNTGSFRKLNPNLADREKILKAMRDQDLKTLREASNFFYSVSGIYSRVIRYMAFMYRYDWVVTPYIEDKKNIKTEKVEEGFNKALKILEDFGVKKALGEIALQVLKDGAYYGYKVESANGIVLQDLPVNYCRTGRYKYGRKPTVEFNMKFFDDNFRTEELREKVLKIFPQEFRKGYNLYKAGKLPAEYPGDSSGWYLLDPTCTVKFNANGTDAPAFVSVLPLIIDLDEAQELDKQRVKQRLLKLIIQQMPMDKNGELIFDPEEAQQLHRSASGMVKGMTGAKVMTTYADVEVADFASQSGLAAQADDVERVAGWIFDEAGLSQMQFNTDGNIALEKSILNDEATMYNLLLQFEEFLNELIAKCSNQPKKFNYRVQLLTTTIYNYKDLSKLYKEQTQLGFSKMLPQVALGQSQRSILSSAYFENEVLDLVNVFIPPLMSSTMNPQILDRKKNSAEGGDGAGRPEKPDDQKSTKTLQNKESMS